MPLLGAALLSGALSSAPMPVCAQTLRIDAARSHVDFNVRLLWLHTVHGRFEQVTGTLDRHPGGRVVVNARVAVDSLAMESPRLRRWVMEPEFFDAARYPTLRFVSEPLPHGALATGGGLVGRLTLRGVTRPVRFTLLPARCAADTCIIEAYGRVQRSEFGMDGHRAVLSDRVELALSIALARAPG